MKKLLLHSCCGPCSTAVIERLKEEYDITIFFSNSNICSKQEFDKRLKSQQKVAEFFNVKLIVDPYVPQNFLDFVNGNEKDKEGGARCERCFLFRLKKTALFAKENDFDCFATTLSISPHKSWNAISKVGQELQNEYNIEFLDENFKKKDGYKRSIEFSKNLELYRQNFCGCKFSLRISDINE